MGALNGLLPCGLRLGSVCGEHAVSCTTADTQEHDFNPLQARAVSVLQMPSLKGNFRLQSRRALGHRPALITKLTTYASNDFSREC